MAGVCLGLRVKTGMLVCLYAEDPPLSRGQAALTFPLACFLCDSDTQCMPRVPFLRSLLTHTVYISVHQKAAFHSPLRLYLHLCVKEWGPACRTLI